MVASFELMYANFGANCYNVSLGVGLDGTVLSTFEASEILDHDLYGAYGLLNNEGLFHFFGTDGDFNNGSCPGVAIDPNGLALSVHETDGVGSTIWANVGPAIGGQGNLQASDPIETDMSGAYAAAAAVGPGQFVVAAISSDIMSPLSLWLVTVTNNNGYEVFTAPISLNPSPGINPTCNQSPQVAFYDGVLAVGGGLMGDLCWYLGTLTGTTFNVQQSWSIPGNNGATYGSAIALGASNTIYSACVTNTGDFNTDIIYWAGSYNPNANYAIEWSTQTNLGFTNANGASLGFLNLGSYGTVILALWDTDYNISLYSSPGEIQP